MFFASDLVLISDKTFFGYSQYVLTHSFQHSVFYQIFHYFNDFSSFNIWIFCFLNCTSEQSAFKHQIHNEQAVFQKTYLSQGYFYISNIYIYKTQSLSVCLSAIEIKLETFRYKQTYESYITFSREAKYSILISIRIVYGGLRAYIYSTYIKI